MPSPDEWCEQQLFDVPPPLRRQALVHPDPAPSSANPDEGWVAWTTTKGVLPEAHLLDEHEPWSLKGGYWLTLCEKTGRPLDLQGTKKPPCTKCSAALGGQGAAHRRRTEAK